MALLGRIQDLTPAEQRELLAWAFQGDVTLHEGSVAMKLVQAVLEEHKELAKEIAEQMAYIRHAYSRQGACADFTAMARAAMPMVPAVGVN